MSAMRRLRIPAWALFWLLVCAGCAGIDNQGACDQASACIGGNEADLAACVRTLELREDVAEVRGCEDEYGAWFDCFFQNASCETQDSGIPCNADADCVALNLGRCEDGQCKLNRFDMSDASLCQTAQIDLAKCDTIETKLF
jgi:hypothetical protein